MELIVSMALALLMAAQQPHVPAEIRAQAIQVATYAISLAQQEGVGLPPAVSETPIPADNSKSEYEQELAEITAERAALIAERDALYRKAEEMGGSRDTIAGYKRSLVRDVKARLDALNERERLLNVEYGI